MIFAVFPLTLCDYCGLTVFVKFYSFLQ